MGMFDSFWGKVACLSCGHENEVEIQFKWGNQLLFYYELGDIVEEAPGGVFIEACDYMDWSCENCGYVFRPSVILRDKKVIKFLDERELRNIKVEELPDVEEKYAKKERYKRDVERGEGYTKEFSKFDLHPLKRGEKIRALERDWVVEEVYKKKLDESNERSLIKGLMGSIGRNQDLWYVYKVWNEELGERWIEVEDRTTTIREIFDYREGNMVVLKEYNLGDEGFIFECLES